MTSETPRLVVLARYGVVPQVARFEAAGNGRLPQRGDQVVVSTDRGEELAVVLDNVKRADSDDVTGKIVRLAELADVERGDALQKKAQDQFSDWAKRIEIWKLELELIDLEWTLDERLVLYVLNERGAETTRLALLTAANGLGIVHVQPVAAEGVVSSQQGGGCGSGGCGSGGCSTH